MLSDRNLRRRSGWVPEGAERNKDRPETQEWALRLIEINRQ